MSWTEIKKVNSDISIPLNERIQYVGGVIPRGCISKYVSIGGQYSSAGQKEMVSVAGSGYVTKIGLSQDHWYNAVANSWIKVNIDGKDAIYINPKDATGGTRRIVLEFNPSNPYSDVSIDDLSNIVNVSSATYYINYPIRFESSLVVTGYTYTQNSNFTAYANITYALEQ